jgi:hypothetical protein
MSKSPKPAILGFLAMGVWATACGQPGDAVPAADVIEERGELVASIRLSPTHTVDFVDYGDVARVRELYHADIDRDAPARLAKMQIGDRPIAEIYEALAGGGMDGRVFTKLRAIDARLARASLPDSRVLTPAASPAVASTGGEAIETRQGQLLPSSCAEPAWNWNGDAAWWVQNFCTGSPAFCRANSFVKMAWGWDGPLRRFQANVFNQSHCAAQGWWQLKWRNNTGTHQPTNTVICPRCVQSDVWSGGTNVQYFNSMEPREQGKMVGMTIYRTP